LARLQKKINIGETMKTPTKTIAVRVTATEYEALLSARKKAAEASGKATTITAFIRPMIAEALAELVAANPVVTDAAI
jgi:hypothetical protein